METVIDYLNFFYTHFKHINKPAYESSVKMCHLEIDEVQYLFLFSRKYFPS